MEILFLVLRFFYNFVVGSSSYSVDNSIHNWKSDKTNNGAQYV